MANFFQDNEDLQFYVDQYLDWAPLVDLCENGMTLRDGFRTSDEAVEFYRDVLNMIGEFSGDEIAPRGQELDETPLKLENGEVIGSEAFEHIFSQMKELGLHGLTLPRDVGGMNAPLLVYMLAGEMIARGDVSVMTHFSFHGGMALAMLLFSAMEGTTKFNAKDGTLEKTRFKEFIEEICLGEAWGAMDITEPNAGSDMAAIRTKAEQDEDGNWFITGEKSFITSGHGKYHFVIARSEPLSTDTDDPYAGLAGLSFYLVPTWTDTPEGRVYHAKVDRLEKKIGHNSSATCAMVFDRSPGYLLGKRGEGFRYMLFLMNNARVGVGFESLGICEAATRLSKDYAAQRKSMGKTIDKHEMIAEYLEEMETDTLALRALTVHGAYHSEIAQRAETNLMMGVATSKVDETRLRMINKRHLKEARRVTPLLKYFGSERAVYMSRMAMQILGGVGYTKEYGAEKLLRDALVLPIYEGTSQIQALMATKDILLNILKNPKDLVQKMAQARWRSLSARDPLEKKVAKLQSLSFSAQQNLISRVAANKVKTLPNHRMTDWATKFFKDWDPKRDFSPALLHAERLTQILADVTMSELLLDQAKQWPERRWILESFIERAMARSEYNYNLITTTGDRLLKRLADEGEPHQLADKKVS
ncbi:MAG: acyl-CoA dehydrogenase family protein [Myxococcota bacterium]|nr:acyl-CoA dehydrogenase family protein [Myxococcota bacterium]